MNEKLLAVVLLLWLAWAVLLVVRARGVEPVLRPLPWGVLVVLLVLDRVLPWGGSL